MIHTLLCCTPVLHHETVDTMLYAEQPKMLAEAS